MSTRSVESLESDLDLMKEVSADLYDALFHLRRQRGFHVDDLDLVTSAMNSYEVAIGLTRKR